MNSSYVRICTAIVAGIISIPVGMLAGFVVGACTTYLAIVMAGPAVGLVFRVVSRASPGWNRSLAAVSGFLAAAFACNSLVILRLGGFDFLIENVLAKKPFMIMSLAGPLNHIDIVVCCVLSAAVAAIIAGRSGSRNSKGALQDSV